MRRIPYHVILVTLGLLLAGLLPPVAAAAEVGESLLKLDAPGCCPMGATFGRDGLWVVDRKANTLFKVDPSDGTVMDKIPTPGFRPTGLAFDGTHLWVADRDKNELYRLSPQTRLVTRAYRIPFRAPRGLAWDGKGLYLADARAKRIYYLDSADGTVIREIPTPYLAPTGLAFDGRYLWAADRNADEIYLLDPEQGHVLAILDSPGPHPWGLAWDGQGLWSLDYQTREIHKLHVRAPNKLIRKAARKLTVGFSIHFFSQGPDPLRTVDLYIAVPRTRYNQIIVDSPRFTPSPTAVLEDRWGQTVAHFHRYGVNAGQELEPHMELGVDLFDVRAWVRPEDVGPLSSIPADVARDYLANGRKYRLKSPVIQAAVKEAVAGATNPYWIARNVYQYVMSRLDYKLSGGWDTAPLLLERGSGSCSEYAFVLIALCRAAGIPARYVAGIVTRGDDAFVDNVFHRWAEIYMPGLGWMPVDPDRGDKDTPRGQALGFGNLENKLLITTVGGGGSEYLEWKYNGNARWTFEGKSRVYVEHIGELAPREEEQP
jgi:transglutaminase-like putative cysteine protease